MSLKSSLNLKLEKTNEGLFVSSRRIAPDHILALSDEQENLLAFVFRFDLQLTRTARLCSNKDSLGNFIDLHSTCLL